MESSVDPYSVPEYDLVIKVKYGDTLRRIVAYVHGRAMDIDMERLRAKILNSFNFSPDADLTLTYNDEDNDVVTLVDDDDLRDAVMQRLNPLRINVTLNTNGAGRSTLMRMPQVQTQPQSLSINVTLNSNETGSSTPMRAPEVQTQPPHFDTSVDEPLKSVPEPLSNVLSKLSRDLMSKAASSAPSFPEILEYCSKLAMGKSHLGPVPQGGVSSNTVNVPPFQSINCNFNKEQEVSNAPVTFPKVLPIDIFVNQPASNNPKEHHDFMLEGAAPAFPELVEYFFKKEESHLDLISQGASSSTHNVDSLQSMDFNISKELKSSKDKVTIPMASSNSIIVDQTPDNNQKVHYCGNMMKGVRNSAPLMTAPVDLNVDLPKDTPASVFSSSDDDDVPLVWIGKDNPKFQKDCNGHTDGKSIVTGALFPMPPTNLPRDARPSVFSPLDDSIPSIWLGKDNPKIQKECNNDGKSTATGASLSVHPTTHAIDSFVTKPSVPLTHAYRSAHALDGDRSKLIPNVVGPSASKVSVKSRNTWPMNGHVGDDVSDVLLPSEPLHMEYPYKRGHGMLQTFHQGIRCDGCGMQPLMGPRFKSKLKEDYNLCNICFSEIGNDVNFTRIDHAPNWSPQSFEEASNHPHTQFQSACKAKLQSRFLQDVTVLDGTLMAPATRFTKIWRMQNNGNAVWPLGTQLIWIGGYHFGDKTSVELKIPVDGVPVDTQFDISVDFTAPSDPGWYISYWRLALPSGRKFGQRVWLLIQVDNSLQDSLLNTFDGSLNLNLPPEGNEQKGKTIIDVNIKPIDGGGHAEMDLSNVAPEAEKPLVNEQLGENQELGKNQGLDLVSYPIIDFSAVPSSPSLIDDVSLTLRQSSIPEVNEVEQYLLKELEEMGFKQIDLNKEILRLNEYDLGQSVDDLCNVAKWEPMLKDLQEMGFHDRVMNETLLAKNGGNVTLVVLDLMGEQNEE